jgi:shikimate dehydrogenase
MTKRAGVIGHPLGHTVSPAMFATAFKGAGIDATYEAWDTPDDTLEGRINALRGGDYLGANVTIPHKQAVIPYLDGTSDGAARIGAVNTIVHADGKLTGHNTDVAGFARSLKDEGGFDAHGKHTVILGSGGASRAVASALVDAGASTIFVIGRTVRKVEGVVLTFKPHTPSGTTISWAYWGDGSYLNAVGRADLIVNCTPIGTKGSPKADVSPVEPHLIRPNSIVFDLVYNPAETPLLAAAKAAGAKPVPGLGMLVYQAAESFKLWTGKDADTKAMFDAARAALAPIT